MKTLARPWDGGAFRLAHIWCCHYWALPRASELLDEAALDPYSFTRDFYLQLRRNDIYDGFPPDEGFEPKRESASPAAAPGS